jgi:mevalonate kinase
MADAVRSFFAQGKLLLTSEYVVLDGVPALAVPTVLGQRLEATEAAGSSFLHWTAEDSDGRVWMNGRLERTEVGWKASGAALEPVAHLLNASEKISQRTLPGGQVRTRLEFPSNYGWGSSSTLISLVAQWQEIDALSLHFATQNGSGYDAICATAKGPMWYRKTADQTAEWESTSLAHWPHDSLYLVHLGHKQRSAADVVRYRALTPSEADLDGIEHAARALFEATSFDTWGRAAQMHETRTAALLGRTPVSEGALKGYPHACKSLGAWGGDFVLVQVANASDLQWFKDRGFSTVLPWKASVVLGS